MTPEETLKICRYVKACLPQQAIDEFTPLAWHDHLEPFTYEDAREAAKQLTGAKAFVQIPEMVAQIKKIHVKRIAAAGDLTPPPECREGEAFHQWMRWARSEIAAGREVSPDHGQLVQRSKAEVRALMAGADPGAPE